MGFFKKCIFLCCIFSMVYVLASTEANINFGSKTTNTNTSLNVPKIAQTSPSQAAPITITNSNEPSILGTIQGANKPMQSSTPNISTANTKNASNPTNAQSVTIPPPANANVLPATTNSSTTSNVSNGINILEGNEPLPTNATEVLDDPNTAIEENLPSNTNLLPNTKDGTHTIESKIVHVSLDTKPDSINPDNLYVGGHVSISYRVLLFNDARIVHVEFNPALDSSKLEVSSVTPFIRQSDGSYLITYVFKIKALKVYIPPLNVVVQNAILQDSMQSDGLSLQAKDLSENKKFSGVIASSLKVSNFQVESYDDTYNMGVLELESTKSNLEDLKIPGIQTQEFSQNSTFSYLNSDGIVLLKFPKSLDHISFEYFNTDTNSFETINLSTSIQTLQADNENLNPVNNSLFLVYIIVAVLIVIFLILAFWRKSVISLIIAILLIAYIIYKIVFNVTSVTNLPDAKVLILPTSSSTVMSVITKPKKLEVLGQTKNYYKVNLDSKVGWIRKDETK
ncbi:hypothetical protein BKH43_05545 [Helicobacter sp. 13S00401-1]|uniref:hypothetical protein n=1 Tax=Helicobacter sp. 13S00401-1 TaxID=1905758 RepID=UPI000BA68043|nr:hypothetical protein [Helicobacter sp. 13S00401-1]PAF50199.1 hypothetical protein BKH43_05545 [Helicobacter sp. 13S00401-1]